MTGWFALHRRAQLRAGVTLLVHAAAGGVGSAAIQLGKAAGAQVIGVVGGPEKAEVARTLGADLVVDRRTEDFRCRPISKSILFWWRLPFQIVHISPARQPLVSTMPRAPNRR